MKKEDLGIIMVEIQHRNNSIKDVVNKFIFKFFKRPTRSFIKILKDNEHLGI